MEVTFKSKKNWKIQRQKSPDSNYYCSILVLTKQIKLKNNQYEKKTTIVYLTLNLASKYLLISHLNFYMLDLVLQNALLNLCQNTQKIFKNQPASKTYRRKMQSRYVFLKPDFRRTPTLIENRYLYYFR